MVHYHLYSEKEEILTWKGESWKALGLVEIPNTQITICGWWTNGELNLGKRRWNHGDGIFIVKPRKMHFCEVCKKWLKFSTRRSSKRVRSKYTGLSWSQHYNKIVEAELYVGVVSDAEGGCNPMYWGYSDKMCFDCAEKYLGNKQVIECNRWRMGYELPPEEHPKDKETPILFKKILEQKRK